MTRFANISQPSRVQRFFGSALFRMTVFVFIFVLLATFTTGGASVQAKDEQRKFLSDAVRRSAVQCYALEGRFPDNLSYLEENYGLIIDHDNFAVYYEPMGSNLIPQIRVVSLTD